MNLFSEHQIHDTNNQLTIRQLAYLASSSENSIYSAHISPPLAYRVVMN